jgi:protoporphyrinogen oxidase
VDYTENGKRNNVETANLISSMPITDLVQAMNPSAPADVIDAAKILRYRDQVQVFLIIDKAHITKDTWIYFPTTPPTFGRMMEPKNWMASMAPEDRSSLLVEYFVFKDDEIWSMTDQKLIEKTMHELEWLGFVKKGDLLKGFVYRHEKSYPLWNLTYKKHLDKIFDFANSFDNLYCVGRNGRFYYNNQDHSIETGLLAAQSIIEGKKYDLSNIGMEDSYFEAGMLLMQSG